MQRDKNRVSRTKNGHEWRYIEKDRCWGGRYDSVNMWISKRCIGYFRYIKASLVCMLRRRPILWVVCGDVSGTEGIFDLTCRVRAVIKEDPTSPGDTICREPGHGRRRLVYVSRGSLVEVRLATGNRISTSGVTSSADRRAENPTEYFLVEFEGFISPPLHNVLPQRTAYKRCHSNSGRWLAPCQNC